MDEELAREIRDAALLETDRIMLPDYPITPAGRLVAKKYRQDLRDWPDSVGFPSIATLPPTPSWSAYTPIGIVSAPISPEL